MASSKKSAATNKEPAENLEFYFYQACQDAQHEMLRAYSQVNRLHGTNQESLSKALGVNKSVISRRLRGDINPTLRTLSDMARAMGFRVKVIFEDLDALPMPNHFFMYPASAGQLSARSGAGLQNMSANPSAGSAGRMLEFTPV